MKQLGPAEAQAACLALLHRLLLAAGGGATMRIEEMPAGLRFDVREQDGTIFLRALAEPRVVPAGAADLKNLPPLRAAR